MLWLPKVFAMVWAYSFVISIKVLYDFMTESETTFKTSQDLTRPRPHPPTDLKYTSFKAF